MFMSYQINLNSRELMSNNIKTSNIIKTSNMFKRLILLKRLVVYAVPSLAYPFAHLFLDRVPPPLKFDGR